MSDTVEDLILKLKSLPEFTKAAAGDSIVDNKDDILDLNKAQMLVLGADSDGAQLGQYSPFSKEERKKKGLQTDYIDLRFTGEFQDKMSLNKIDDLSYEIDSTDPKWNDKLRPRWPDALGLDSDNEERLTKILTDHIDFQVDNYLSTGASPILVNV